jgi:hypothetical protein
MNKLAVLIAALALWSVVTQAGLPYERYFSEATLRVDYYHTGTKGAETFSLDGAFQEGPWPGSRVELLDTLNLGEYQMRVYDRATGALIFSRGFSSIFNEWQTTDEAAEGIYRTFSETVRSPFPLRAVQLSIARRDKRMTFHELFSTIIDPSIPSQIHRTKKGDKYAAYALMENGKASSKVDIVILGDGYARGDMGKFRKDAKTLNEALFTYEPFKSRRKDFNVWLVEVESPKSGIDIPDLGTWRGNTLGTHYNTFNTPRYVLTTDNKAVRDIAGAVPYDYICILVNDTRYGGGGIYNLYSTTYTNELNTSVQWQMEYTYVHEFGHSFAGLADEYYTSSTGYNDFSPPGVEPWEPNITALRDKNKLKWSDLVTQGVEIPTPWDKVRYDSIRAIHRKLDRLAPDYYTRRAPLMKAEEEILRNSPNAGKVGAFEGAGYASTGLYRPSVNCRMFSLSLAAFDPVCQAAISRVIDFYSR